MARQTLAGAQIEGHSRPAPVVDGEFQRGIGFRVGNGAGSGFFAITGYISAIDSPGQVLRTDSMSGDLFRRPWTDGAPYLGFLVAHRVGVEGNWRFHRDEHPRRCEVAAKWLF